MRRDAFKHPGPPRRWPALSVVGLVGLSSPALAWTEADIGPIAQVTLEAEIGPRPVTGVSASIVFKSGKHWSGAAGFADAEHKLRLTPSDRMRIGSQTKTYTGTLVLELVDEGKVRLDDTLAKWLPELHVPKDDKITVRNLLSMTAGIADYLDGPAPTMTGKFVIDEWVSMRGLLVMSPEQLVAAAVNYKGPPDLPPIGTMGYSNTNFVLLGMIAEKAMCGAGAGPSCSLDQEIKRRVIDKVGLKETEYPTNDRFAGPHGDGYVRTVEGAPLDSSAAIALPTANAYVNFARIDPSVPWSAGAMISSPDDEALWSSQLSGNAFSLLSADLQKQRLDASLPGEVAGMPARYGLGIYYQRSPIDGAELVGHAGSISGYTSAVFRRTDLQTDYAANVSTFVLTDNFMAPAMVWLLDRNVANAIAAQGDCGADIAPGGGVCTGASVRQTGIAVDGGSLELKPSGVLNSTYVPDPTAKAATPASTPAIVSTTTPVPTVAVYRHETEGVKLRRSARLTVDAGAMLSSIGNRSAAVAMSGSGDMIEIDGAVTATGTGVAGIRDQGSGNHLTIKGVVTSSTAWWNPDLPSIAPSTYMMAVPDDTSAAIVLAGSGSPHSGVSIDGTVRTQRLGTAALLVDREGHDYHIAVGSSGRLVGPTVIRGDDAYVDISSGGRALYVAESAALLPPAAAAAAAEPKAEVSDLSPALLTARRRFGLGVPGLPRVSLDEVVEKRIGNENLETRLHRRFGIDLPLGAAPGADESKPVDSRIPPVAVILQGNGDALTVEGVVGGTICEDLSTTYTRGLAAVKVEGIDDRLSVSRTGVVNGKIITLGRGAKLNVDGILFSDASTIRGGIGASVCKKSDPNFPPDAAALSIDGTDNSFSVAPSGTVNGNIVVGGRGAKLRIDGNVVGDVTVADSSATLDGTGQIKGSLSIGGVKQQQHGTLKIVSD